MSFTAPKFTNAGRQLHTRVLAGDTLTFTAIKLGDGTMTTEPIAALTDLIHGIITLSVHEVRRNADYADITSVFQNTGMQSGFYWREIGIFAADPDYPNDRSHDILYCYQNAAELAEYIPSASSAVIEKIVRVACVVGDAENVTVGLDSQAYAKAADLQSLEEKHSNDVQRINSELNAIDPSKTAAKSEPEAEDGVLLSDSAASGGLKRLSWAAVKTALGKVFVPLARKINGKSLGSDVTLTAADIKMPDSEEDVGAAMAKRVKAEHFLPSEDSLDSAIVSGMYRCSTNSGLPDEGASYGQLLVVHGGYDTIAQVYFPWDRKTVYIRSGAPASIGGNNNWLDWWAVPRVEKPEVHELLLVSGVTPEKSCVYYKSQENLVVGQLDLQASAAAYQEIAVALLPEGFRPSRDTPFMVSSCARKGVVWEGTGWGRISSDGYIHLYQNIAWGWAQAQFSFIAD